MNAVSVRSHCLMMRPSCVKPVCCFCFIFLVHGCVERCHYSDHQTSVNVSNSARAAWWDGQWKTHNTSHFYAPKANMSIMVQEHEFRCLCNTACLSSMVKAHLNLSVQLRRKLWRLTSSMLVSSDGRPSNCNRPLPSMARSWLQTWTTWPSRHCLWRQERSCPR